MMYDFNADEVFEMAEKIEINGANFYRNASGNISDPKSKQLLEELAAMEDEHLKTFSEMRRQLTDKEKETMVFDPENETVAYLRALADIRVFFEKEIDTSSMEEILKDAIVAEKDSIVFYLGIKEMVSDEKGKHRIDKIIKEEMGHIRLLSKELVNLNKK
jgi:rubrerythrin